MPQLRLKPVESGAGSHGDEVLSCAFAPDGQQVISGGWDGCVRIWDAATGVFRDSITVGKKPVSAVAFSPDGTNLLSGDLDGMLTHWDRATLDQHTSFLAHTRPISCIAFLHFGETIASGSWDRKLILWHGTHSLRTLAAHGDAVVGCQVSLDDKLIVTWSHDQSIALWELARAGDPVLFQGHGDQVLAGAISPDGRWLASGSRDGSVILWDVAAKEETASLQCEGEVRFCGFLRNGKWLVVADTTGRAGLYALPQLEACGSVQTYLPIRCGALAPSGAQLALGCGDGLVRIVDVEGFDEAPLLACAYQGFRRSSTKLQRFLGTSKEVAVYQGMCPACLAMFERPEATVGTQFTCSSCRRNVQVAFVVTLI